MESVTDEVFEGFDFIFVRGSSIYVSYVSMNNICSCYDEGKGTSCVIQGRFFEADMRICL